MPRKYAGFSAVAGVTNGTNIQIISGAGTAAVRPKLYDLVIGSRATADSAGIYHLLDTSAASTHTNSNTPSRLDAQDAAATATLKGNSGGADATFGTVLYLPIPLNQRATFRWVAVPGGEVNLPASTTLGWGLRSIAASPTFVVDACVYWEE